MYFIKFIFVKQKTAYELRISDWSSDVCSSDLRNRSRARQSAGSAEGLIRMEVVGLPEAKLDKVIERYEMLQAQMSAGGHGAEAFVRLSKEYAEVAPLFQAIQAWRQNRQGVTDLRAPLASRTETGKAAGR